MATKMTYGEQLKHPFWQRKRLEVLQAAEFGCARCHDKETTLHVHHKHYVKGRMAWEYEIKELIALCEPCHEEAHEEKEQFNLLLASLRADGPFSLGDAEALVAGWSYSHVGEEIAGEYQARPFPFHLGLMAGQMERADLDINLILDLGNCFADGGADFTDKLQELLDRYVPPIF